MSLIEQSKKYQQALMFVTVTCWEEFFVKSDGRWVQEKVIMLDKILSESS